jgi:TolB protein
MVTGGAGLLVLLAQDARITLTGGQRPAMAIPDLRGAGDAQNFMGTFNQTLWGDVQGSGFFRMAPKTMYPTTVPQQPADFREPPAVVATPRARGQQTAAPPNGGGTWLRDWSGPPVAANYLAFGYTAVQNGVFVLRAWLYDLGRPTANAQVVGKTYLGTVDEAGAQKVAHEFAADIISLFGGKSLFNSHIYFVSNRTGHKEIWVMDPDGKNQRQITHFNNTSIQPAVSPDGSRIAFTSFVKGNPGIFVFSVDPVRDLRFYNQAASVNSSPSFTPDGKRVIYSSSAGSGCCRIFIANVDGSGLRPITSATSIDTEPKVNPKTGNEVIFSSGRSGPEQLYRMNMDGADIERLTPGEGEASNPSWHPEGQILAYAWTRGFAAGAWNVFTMDVATRKYTQLTHGEGRNEHPSWAPDGVHLVFDSTRHGRSQIYTMLADGTQLQQLTTQGSNETPAWGK